MTDEKLLGLTANQLAEEASRLRTENTALRQQLADVTESMGRVEERCAKLRKLMLEIWRSCTVSEDDCAKCPHRVKESDEVWCDIPFLMESLGVEVPS